MRDFLLAIDPGTYQSGVCLMRTEDLKPIWFGKFQNDEIITGLIRDTLEMLSIKGEDCHLVLERISNPAQANSEVFLTCEWIGRFDTVFSWMGMSVSYIFRHQEYRNLCANLYSRNDKGVKAALVDRFAYGQPNYGKGTAKSPGWFYRFHADVWNAYAVGVTAVDLEAGT